MMMYLSESIANKSTLPTNNFFFFLQIFVPTIFIIVLRAHTYSDTSKNEGVVKL